MEVGPAMHCHRSPRCRAGIREMLLRYTRFWEMLVLESWGDYLFFVISVRFVPIRLADYAAQAT